MAPPVETVTGGAPGEAADGNQATRGPPRADRGSRDSSQGCPGEGHCPAASAGRLLERRGLEPDRPSRWPGAGEDGLESPPGRAPVVPSVDRRIGPATAVGRRPSTSTPGDRPCYARVMAPTLPASPLTAAPSTLATAPPSGTRPDTTARGPEGPRTPQGGTAAPEPDAAPGVANQTHRRRIGFLWEARPSAQKTTPGRNARGSSDSREVDGLAGGRQRGHALSRAHCRALGRRARTLRGGRARLEAGCGRRRRNARRCACRDSPEQGDRNEKSLDHERVPPVPPPVFGNEEWERQRQQRRDRR